MIRRETIALIFVVLAIFLLMYFLEIRRVGYVIQGYGVLDSCRILGVKGAYILMNDIETRSTCFFIAADNVTIDLNNHVVQGDGGLEDYGVFVKGYDSAVIKNGIIRGFNTGVFLTSSQGSFVTDNQIENNFDSGISVVNSSNIVVQDNLLMSNSYYGIKLLASYKNLIMRNTFHGNFDSGLFINSGFGNVISYNILSGNSWNGISLYRSNENFLQKNAIHNNFWHGISLVLSSYNLVNGSVLDGNSRGVYLFSSNDNIFSDVDINSVNFSIYVANSDRNLFQNMHIARDSDNAVSLISSGNDQTSDNTFIDLFMENNGVSSTAGPFSSNVDNVFLNADYADEVLGGSDSYHTLRRAWWLEVYTLEEGKPVQANVEIYDNFGNILYERTNLNGHLKMALTDYVATPIKKDQYKYRIDAVYSGKKISKLLQMNENKVEVFDF